MSGDYCHPRPGKLSRRARQLDLQSTEREAKSHSALRIQGWAMNVVCYKRLGRGGLRDWLGEYCLHRVASLCCTFEITSLLHTAAGCKRPTATHEGKEAEYGYSSILSLTSAL